MGEVGNDACRPFIVSPPEVEPVDDTEVYAMESEEMHQVASKLGTADEKWFKVIEVGGTPHVKEITEEARKAGALAKVLVWFLITNLTFGGLACRVGIPSLGKVMETWGWNEADLAWIGTCYQIGSLLSLVVALQAFAWVGLHLATVMAMSLAAVGAALFIVSFHHRNYALAMVAHGLQGLGTTSGITFQSILMNAMFAEGRDMRLAFAWDGVYRSLIFLLSPNIAIQTEADGGPMLAVWVLLGLTLWSVGCSVGLIAATRRWGGLTTADSARGGNNVLQLALCARRLKGETLVTLAYAGMFEATWTPLLWFGVPFLTQVFGYKQKEAEFYIFTVLLLVRLIAGPFVGVALTRYGKRSLCLKLASFVVAAGMMALAIPQDFPPLLVIIPLGVCISSLYTILNVVLPVYVQPHQVAPVYTFQSASMAAGGMVGVAAFGFCRDHGASLNEAFMMLASIGAFGSGLLTMLHLNDVKLSDAALPFTRCGFWMPTSERTVGDRSADMVHHCRSRAVSTLEFFTAMGQTRVYEDYYTSPAISPQSRPRASGSGKGSPVPGSDHLVGLNVAE